MQVFHPEQLHTVVSNNVDKEDFGQSRLGKCKGQELTTVL